jgi:drug/metabolite transporter (DMT)-like permease
VVVGLTLYGAGVGLWLYGLSQAPLYMVYTFTMLTFVLVGVLGFLLLGEHPSILVVIGWLVIALGVTIVYFGSMRGIAQ